MPFIDILKEWDIKKHGLTGLFVAVILIGCEEFLPKDRSCENQVQYLQIQNTALVNELIFERQKGTQKDTLIKKYKVQDSVWTEKTIKPAKAIVKRSKK